MSEICGYQIINAADLTQKIAFYQAEILTDKDEKSELKVHFLPSSETHLRPLIDSLKTDSERIAVWQNVVYDSKGEKSIRESVSAASVYVSLAATSPEVMSKTSHLYEISKAPKDTWQILADLLIKCDWSVKDTQAAIDLATAVQSSTDNT